MPRHDLAAIHARASADCIGIDHPEGWDELLIALDTALVAVDPDYEIIQTKEKFGTLRFYTHHNHNDRCGEDTTTDTNICTFRTIIDKAEERSASLCQECGNPGELRDHGWAATLCETHDQTGDRGYGSALERFRRR